MNETAPWEAGTTDGWKPFLEGTAQRNPLPFFEQAMQYVDGDDGDGRLAVDLGCGGGAEVFALLQRGWRVHATDGSPTAERLIRARLSPRDRDGLSIEIGPFHEVELPQADLVYAQMSLPFAGSDLDAATANALAAVCPGGAFAGHFFGEEDDWIDEVNVAAVDRDWIDERFDAFSETSIEETKQDGPYGLEGSTKHWHYYFVLARR